MARDTAQMEVAADRRTELAANRTVFAAERTYAAWVRTGLVALASGIGAKSLLAHILPGWLIGLTGSVLVLFSAFCFGAAVWRQIDPGPPPPKPDTRQLPAPPAHPGQRLSGAGRARFAGRHLVCTRAGLTDWRRSHMARAGGPGSPDPKCRKPPLPAAFRRARRSRDYFSWVEMLEKLVLRLVPIVLTTAMMATEMPAAIRPYSMAVAPDWSLRKATNLFM
jgi:putative membrane protein